MSDACNYTRRLFGRHSAPTGTPDCLISASGPRFMRCCEDDGVVTEERVHIGKVKRLERTREELLQTGSSSLLLIALQ